MVVSTPISEVLCSFGVLQQVIGTQTGSRVGPKGDPGYPGSPGLKGERGPTGECAEFVFTGNATNAVGKRKLAVK